MSQFLRPSADTVRTGWTDDVGGTTDIFGTIDESSASDAGYIKTPTPPGANEYETLVTSASDPASSADHIVRWRRRKQPSTAVQEDLVLRLLQGANQITSQSDTNLGTSFASTSYTLSGAEADAISDYSDLRLEFVGTQSGGSSSAGPTYTGTGANFNDGGTTAWTNPTNIEGDTTSTAATCVPPANGNTSQRLRCSNFGFSVSGTILGVTVEVEQQAANANRHRWNSVRLLVAGVETGNDNSDASAIPTTKGFKTFGGAGDGWGAGLTAANVSDSGFGVSLKIDRNSVSSTTTSLFRARITVTSIVNGDIEISWAEMEVPDAPAAPPVVLLDALLYAPIGRGPY